MPAGSRWLGCGRGSTEGYFWCPVFPFCEILRTDIAEDFRVDSFAGLAAARARRWYPPRAETREGEMKKPGAARRSAWAFCALALLCTGGCERFDETPREVAAAFWAALETRDLDAALALSDAGSRSELRELTEGLSLANVDLGQILRNESAALVETRADFVRRDMDLAFNTHLTRAGATWRVDVNATEHELRRTALAASFEDVRESISESTDLLVEEFEKRALQASEALREALEELEESLREEPAPAT